MTRGARIEDIEVLRAIAVLMVVLQHARNLVLPADAPVLLGIYEWFNAAHGVDLFFAISGFVITRDLLPRLRIGREQGKGNVLREVSGFWIRRAWRLLPSAWACLLFIAVVGWALDSSGVFGTARANINGSVAALLQVANLYFPFHYAAEPGLGVTYHFWSLSLEEQFYLVLPLLMLLSGRAFPWLAGALVLMQLVSLRPTFIHWMFRTDALFIGVLLAWWSGSRFYARCEPRWLRSSRRSGGLVLALLAGVLLLANAERLNGYGYALSVVTLASGLLVFIASHDRGSFVPRGPAKRVVLWAGARSYAIYLWHVPVFHLVREAADRAGSGFGLEYGAGTSVVLLLLALGVVAGISELNFRALEGPLRRRGITISERWIARA